MFVRLDCEVHKGASGNGFSSLLIYPGKKILDSLPCLCSNSNQEPQEVGVRSPVKCSAEILNGKKKVQDFLRGS